MGIGTKIKPLSVSQTEMHDKLVVDGGHFEIQDGCHTQVSQWSKVIVIGILDIANMGIATKMKPLSVSQMEI